MNKAIQRGLVAVGVLAAAGSSHAALDVTAATTAITEAGAAVAVIGAAVFLVVIGMKVWKWMKGAA